MILTMSNEIIWAYNTVLHSCFQVVHLKQKKIYRDRFDCVVWSMESDYGCVVWELFEYKF